MIYGSRLMVHGSGFMAHDFNLNDKFGLNKDKQ